MNQPHPVTAGWISCVALIAACATTPGVAPSAIPDAIKAPASESFALEAAATGVQIYECASGKDAPGLYAWTFNGPQADLFDRAGRKIGTHYAGPTWEAHDGSKVVGAVAARDDGPDRSAVPWLLLRAKTTAGTGIFGRTTSIQRVHTVGGIAPDEPCTIVQAGQVANVAYTAIYYFYTARP